MAFDPAKIEERIDRVITGGIEIDDSKFGLELKTLNDAFEYAKAISISKQAIPEFMRNEPGVCNYAVTRSIRWGIDPYFIAENMYLVRNPRTGEEKIAFMSQLINAVINKFTPMLLKGRLRCRYEGEGDAMRCIVFGTFKNELDPVEYRSPTLGERKKSIGYNEKGHFKGSPLYESDPEQQMWYYASRGWIRRYCSDVLAGAYSGEELAEAGMERMKDVTPKDSPEQRGLVQRLQDSKARHAKKDRRGFDHDKIKETIEAASKQEVKHGEEEGTASGHDAEVRRTGREADSHGGVEDIDQKPDGDTDRQAGRNDGTVAGAEGQDSQSQSNIFPPDRKEK